MIRPFEIKLKDLIGTLADGLDVSTDAFPVRHGSLSRALKQNSYGDDGSSASEYVGLGVLVAVCLLFMLNLCLCAYKVMQGEEMALQAQTRPRLGPARNPTIPVIFVNPGGSVRIGSKLKRSGSEPLDANGEPSAPTLRPHESYLFSEVAIDLDKISVDQQQQTTEEATVRSDNLV